ncbi:APC family permease [Mycoplasmopsis felis]|uniref:APC family permease n=1 Tax=Mycoplasmopsis felis TaxID=33923 RepID=UPI002AFF755D|nr:APC family permease [Mycoplasmopsis felis]WQQ06534.1 APC family permease [Mycoplasmopsis felis]
MKNKHFTEKSFTFLTINFIVGLGFLTTITEIFNLGLWGYLVIGLSLLTVCGTALVFSRMGNAFKDHYGGSYSYVRHLDKTLFEEELPNFSKWERIKRKLIHNFCFYVGWNQFLQSPVLSSISPLFLASAFELAIPKTTHNFEIIIWSIRIISIVFFGSLILISTKGLKLNTKVVFMTSVVKWGFIALGLFILIGFIIKNSGAGYLDLVSKQIKKQVSVSLIFVNVLIFIFAFAGIEDMASMAKDAYFKNFRKVLFISLGIVSSIYFVSYTLFLGLKLNENDTIEHFSKIYHLALGSAGIVVFIIGFIFNDIGYKITQSVSTARKLIPLALDNHINPKYADHNQHGEYKNAILFTAILTFLSMLVLWLLPTLLSKDSSENNPYFTAVIGVNAVALLLEDTFTTVVALILSRKKIIDKIPLWEKIIYSINIVWILTLLNIYLFPFILNNDWKQEHTFVIVVYLSFILIGFVFKLSWTIKKKRKSKN